MAASRWPDGRFLVPRSYPDVSKYLPAAAVVASSVAFTWAARLPVAAVVGTLATLAAMALPGILLVRRVLAGESSALTAVVFGSVLGLSLGRFGLVAVGLLLGPGWVGPAVFLLALAVPSAIALTRIGLPAWNEDDGREARWLFGLLSVLVVVLAVAYWGVGRPTPAGFTFTPYFDRDYMNHVAVTAELGRGLPPENPYFAGQRLHYYWGFHLWPAAVQTLTGVTARQALTATLAPTVALFVAALALWTRLYLDNRAIRYAAVALALFAFSYIGPLFLAKLTVPGLLQRLPVISSREYSFLSHSWFRDFLYEPHAVTGLTLLLAVLVLSHPPAARRQPLAGLLVGVAFGAMLVTDAFIGLVGLLYYAALNLRAFLRDPSTRRPVLFAAAVTVAVLAAAVALGIFPVGGRGVRLVLHPMTKVAPVYLLVELGPLLVFGAAGVAVLVYRGATGPFRPLLGLTLLALAIGFTLQVPVEPNIVIRKGLKVAQLPVVVFVGVALLAAWSSPRRVAWAVAAMVVALPGLVTLGTDLLLYLDQVETRSPAATYVSRDEMEMLDWVRVNTPPDAVLLMGYPDRIFGEATPLLIEALGERRTYYGNAELPNTFQVPPELVARRHEQVEALFKATQPSEVAQILRDLPPVYLYLDEGALGPMAAFRQLEAQGILRHVHQSGRFSLKQVVHPGDAHGISSTVARRDQGPADGTQAGQPRAATNIIAAAPSPTR
jgi:hypothetical protein